MSDYDMFSSLLGLSLGLILFVSIIALAIIVLYVIGTWKLFKKAGKQGWEALIPFYSTYVLVEISGLNYHYLNECAQRKQFKQCPRCKEPVLIKDYESHVSDNSCNQYKSPNVANRCPLCHNDIVPAGKVGWEVHLIQQTCPNNPRSAY